MAFSRLLALSVIASGVFAHFNMVDPPPPTFQANPYAGSNVDAEITSPLMQDGSNWPCKNQARFINTESGAVVDEWAVNSVQNFTVGNLVGPGATHGGGSAQVALSSDGGKTFKVIHSYIGGFLRDQPANTSGQPAEFTYSFTVPMDFPPTDKAVFLWSFYNAIGNREVAQDCAFVKITSPMATTSSVCASSAPLVAFKDRPDLFKATIEGSAWMTVDNKDVVFPDPGPDVTYGSSDKLAPPMAQ